MQRGQPATTGPLTKLYWSAHVDELKQEFFRAKNLGPATAEEWLKGLDGRGSEWRNDFSRWENWATANGGVRQMRGLLYPGYRPHTSINIVISDAEGKAPSAVRIPGLDSANQSGAVSKGSGPSPQTGLTSESLSRSSSSGAPSYGQGRLERTKEEIAELKAARKAEIERRALSLDPPLPASVLAHMPSFQAALQIIAPLDDQGWEVLHPRLIAQRPDAEQREKETVARNQREMEEKRNQFVATKSARDAEDADWDEVQAPLRARIAGYADEIIRDGWDEGEKIGRDNCSKFAVEVLIYIRKRFYADIAKDAAAARAAGKSPTVDPPEGPFTQKLTLDNMKWIFDVKVKPHTEKYRKELFLCNGCDITTRYYGFEGVIQHYAAKHTHALSIGNVVVHWRAEWPEHPPFTSEPKHVKAGFNQSQQPPGYNGYQPSPTQPIQTAPPAGQPSTFRGPSWGDTYRQGSQGPYPAAAGGYAQPTGYAPNLYPSADLYQSYGQPPAAGPYSYNYGAYQSNGQPGYQALQPSPFSNQYKFQLEEMARISRDLWNATSNMKDTLAIVRVQVVIFHLAKRFHTKFGTPLSLATFIDGLSNHKDMRPVRNVNGLICRVCHQGVGGYVASEEERKSWSLPQLTSHFQSKHLEPFLQMGQYGQPPEWTVEMVLLPEPSAVSNLRSAVALDGQKYHLVNEAVPQLLAASDQAQTAAAQPHGWPDQSSYYQGYQTVTSEPSAQFYGQSQPTVPQATAGDTGQYSTAAGSSSHYPAEASVAYNYMETPAAGATTVPIHGGYAPPEHASASQNMIPTPNDPNGGRSSQGFRQGRDQTNRQSKKNKKKGANGGRDSTDEEARKRQEEEEKMAEEEAEREADIIRAMWAKDRANAASKTVQPEGDKAEDQTKVDEPSKGSKPSSKANTPQQRHRFQSRPPRDSPGALAGGSPSVGSEVRQSQTSGHRNAPHHGHQLSNVSYVEDNRNEPSHGSWRRTPEAQGRYEAPAPQQQVERPPARSPLYMDYGRPPLPAQYSQRSPPRQPTEPLYQPRQPRQPLPPADDARFERSVVHQPPRDEYMPRGYPPPATEYVEIEVIEYRGADGTIWVEERPLRRIPNPEAERYYRDAPPPLTNSAAFDRGDYPPPRRADQPPLLSQQPPPGDPYRPTYERAYSRAPPPLAPAGVEMYDPRQPLDASAQRRNDAPPPGPPLARTAPSYYDEEYDPRFPAGPLPPSNAPAPAPRPSRYQ